MKKLLLFICSLTLFLSFNITVFADEDVITSNVYRQSMYYRNNSNNVGADTNQTTGGNSIVVPGAGSFSANIPVFFIFSFNDYKFNDNESYQVKVNISTVDSDKDYDYSWNYNSFCQLEEVGTGATMPVYCTIEDEGKTLVFSFKSIYQINDSSLWLFRYGNWTNDVDSIINNMAATTSSESVNPNYRLIYNEKIDLSILENQNQTIINQNNQTNQNLENINDSLTNSDSSGASSDAENFFSGFNTDTFGLTSIITSPLNLIGSITGSSCSPLGLPLPYVNKSLTLPCMSSIYQKHFGSFLSLYQTITFGIVAYWVCVRIFNLVKDFKNPEHDEIEVLDL